jgi:hypothetical protein
MLKIFYWGSLIFFIIFGLVSLYGIIVLVKNWKTAQSGNRSKAILGVLGAVSSGIVCYIIFVVCGLFYK